jgi:hypothetical protein
LEQIEKNQEGKKKLGRLEEKEQEAVEQKE